MDITLIHYTLEVTLHLNYLYCSNIYKKHCTDDILIIKHFALVMLYYTRQNCRKKHYSSVCMDTTHPYVWIQITTRVCIPKRLTVQSVSIPNSKKVKNII